MIQIIDVLLPFVMRKGLKTKHSALQKQLKTKEING